MTNPQPRPDMNRLLREAQFGRENERQRKRREAIARRLGLLPAHRTEPDNQGGNQ